MHPIQPTIQIVIPIYKSDLSDLEFFSINHSLQILTKYPVVFAHPKSLSLSYYKSNFQRASFVGFDDSYFTSVSAYNQLCYNKDFYLPFINSDRILLLQPDAIVIKDDLEYWSLENYDYVGSPECILSHYDLSPFPPFSELKFFAPVVLQGLNGGLSLRNPKAFIKVISEYIALTSAFQNYAGGVGEDIFFSVLGRVSKEFKIPNEVTASEFALTGDFSGWSKFNNGKFPMGFHRWYTNEADKSHVLGILAKLSSLAS